MSLPKCKQASVCPASNYYALGSPIFSKVKIHLDGGKSFTINAENLSEQNVYVSKSELKNGKEEFLPCFISHDDIMNGEELKLTMSSVAAGSNTKYFLKTISNSNKIMPVPYFVYESKTFSDSVIVHLNGISDSSEIVYYRGDILKTNLLEIKNPFVVKNSEIITAINATDFFHSSNDLSESVTFKKILYQKTVAYKYPYSEQYTADGMNGLVDEVFGETNSFVAWQGFHGTDFEATVDLGAKRTIRHIQTDWLNARWAWIFNPTKVQYFISDDNIIWKEVYSVDMVVEEHDASGIMNSPSLECSFNPLHGRYVKVFAKSIQKCPAWHLGKGEPSWLFVDEIQID